MNNVANNVAYKYSSSNTRPRSKCGFQGSDLGCPSIVLQEQTARKASPGETSFCVRVLSSSNSLPSVFRICTLEHCVISLMNSLSSETGTSMFQVPTSVAISSNVLHSMHTSSSSGPSSPNKRDRCASRTSPVRKKSAISAQASTSWDTARRRVAMSMSPRHIGQVPVVVSPLEPQTDPMHP